MRNGGVHFVLLVMSQNNVVSAWCTGTYNNLAWLAHGHQHWYWVTKGECTSLPCNAMRCWMRLSGMLHMCALVHNACARCCTTRHVLFSDCQVDVYARVFAHVRVDAQRAKFYFLTVRWACIHACLHNGTCWPWLSGGRVHFYSCTTRKFYFSTVRCTCMVIECHAFGEMFFS